MGGGGKAGGKGEFTSYYMSMHYGICAQADAITELVCAEKSMWKGRQTVAGPITISKPQLFGGPKKEGGVAGIAYYLPGDDEQVLPDGLAARYGETSLTCPGYRGIASVFFVGQVESYVPGSPEYAEEIKNNPNYAQEGHELGFYWTANSPYLRDIWMTMERVPKGLSSTYAVIDDSPLQVNPSHMIYECLTNNEWGMGSPPGLIETSTFEYAAQVLHQENFGLAMLWSRQSPIEEFINEIIDHIHATLYVRPSTGKFEIKLWRGDYNENELLVLDPTNSKITNFARKSWGETVNEIVVTWTNPKNEKEETITVHDLASISVQGIISDGRNYYGIRNASLAARIGKRDIQLSSAPIATFDIECDRSARNLVPGDCVKLNWPEYGIDGVILRVNDINYGTPKAPVISINGMEDIFSRPSADYTEPEENQWEDPSSDPTPIPFVRIITTPSYFMQLVFSSTELNGLEYPEVFSSVLAVHDDLDTTTFDLLTEDIQPNGSSKLVDLGTWSTVSYTELTVSLPQESTSIVLNFPGVIGRPIPTASTFMLIGGNDETESEIALIRDVTGSGGFTIDRGVLDTIPREWPIGTPVYFVNNTNAVLDQTPRSTGETAKYWLLSRTSQGMLPFNLASEKSATLTERPYLPIRPANVKVKGISFGTVDISGDTDVVVTWANRNRLNEPTSVLKWTDGTATPESAQTTTIYLLESDETTVIHTISGLTGTTHTFLKSLFGVETMGAIKVVSVRDGFESLQGHIIRVEIV